MYKVIVILSALLISPHDYVHEFRNHTPNHLWARNTEHLVKAPQLLMNS